MRDEVRRINKLVAEGKLTPDDAADLIDAFYASEREDQEPTVTPPPPPPGAPNEVPPGRENTARDPFRSIVDQIEKLTKDSLDSVDWKEVSKQARNSARKGFDFLRTGIDDISRGKVTILGTSEIKELSMPLSVPEGKTLKIENATGDIRVIGGTGEGKVEARAIFKGGTLEDARRKAAAYALVIEESDNQVVIRQPETSGVFVDIRIELPSPVAVDVKVDSGDVHVNDTGSSAKIVAGAGDVMLTGLNGVIEIHSGSGNVTIEKSQTSGMTIENKSGDVEIDHVIGNMNIRSSTGDLRIIAADGKVIALESISGDVSIDLEGPVSGSLSVRTVSGDSYIAVQDGSDCRVSLATLRGTLNCGLELEDKAEAPQRITGKLGQGTGTLDVSAVTGDVRLEMRQAEAAEVTP